MGIRAVAPGASMVPMPLSALLFDPLVVYFTRNRVLYDQEKLGIPFETSSKEGVGPSMVDGGELESIGCEEGVTGQPATSLVFNEMQLICILTFEKDVVSVASGSDGVLEERGGEVDLASVLTTMGQRERRERESAV